MDHKTPHILIVDDDADLLSTMSDVLTLKGFAPVSAQTGRAALAQLETRVFDVALIDLQLGDISGLEVLSGIKARVPETECILLTGHATQDSAIQAIQLSVFGYFQKPFDMDQVLLSIQRAVEKCQSVRALRESEQNLKKAQHYARVGSWTWNVKTNQLHWSDEMYRIFGIDQSAFTGNLPDVVARAIHPDDREKVDLSNLSVSEQGKPVALEYRVVWDDGTIRVVWAEAGEMIVDEDGAPAFLSGIVQDLTERKQAEERLTQSHDLLANLARLVPGVIYQYRLYPDGRSAFPYASPGMNDIYEVTPAEVREDATVVFGRLHPDDYDRVAAAIQESARTLQTFYAEFRVILPRQGLRWRWSQAHPERTADGGTLWYGIISDVTERKLAEEKIRTQMVALETAANGIVITDKNGMIEWINPAWSALTGYSKEEAIGKNPRILKSGIHAPEFYDDLWKTILAGKPWRSELVNRRKDGTFYNEEETITPVLDESGTVRNFIAIKQDITERKQAEHTLARTNMRLQSLRLIDHALLSARAGNESADMEALRHLAALVPCGNIDIIALDEISDSARIIARAISEDFSVSHVSEPVFIGDLHLSEMQGGEISVVKLEPEKINSLEKQIYSAGGRALVNSPLVIQGRLIGILALNSASPDFFTAEHLEIIKDVSAQLALSLHHENLLNEIRRHAEQLEKRVQERTVEIEATRQRLELAVNAGEIGVWDANLEDNTVVWDERMHLIHGTTPESFDNSFDAWWRMIHPQDVLQSQKRLKESLELTGLFMDEHRIVRADGAVRYVSANAVVLRDAENNPQRMIGVNVDVTERREVEETMRRANREMERALRIKDEFLANMSHELRTPLNAVMGISESLLEQTAGTLNEKQQRYIATINESGAHLLALINDILDLSKIEAGRMELRVTDISIESLFESSYRMVKEMAQKKNISIMFEADADAQNIRGDSRRLLQMLVNLLSNAVKFTPAGGKAGVRAAVYPDLREIHFVVWDTGIGIAAEDMPRLFQSFVQLDSSLSRASSGTGLGLMLVMQMARMHGGNVSAQSIPNEGSRFTISLPWSPAEQDSAAGEKIEKTESNPPQEKNRAGNILLVEDTESVILLLSDYLSARGYHLTVARGGVDGLLMAKAKRPDLLLLDVQMPGMNGFEVIEKIRADEFLRDVPVIALTALAMPGDRERCLAAGMDDYVSKPIRLKELSRVIETYLQLQTRDKK